MNYNYIHEILKNDNTVAKKPLVIDGVEVGYFKISPVGWRHSQSEHPSTEEEIVYYSNSVNFPDWLLVSAIKDEIIKKFNEKRREKRALKIQDLAQNFLDTLDS